MNRERIRALLSEKFGGDLPCSAPELRFKCPRCHLRGKTADISGHLHVNVEVEKFNCFRCEWRGPLAALFKLYGIASTSSVSDWSTTIRGMSILSGKSYDDGSGDGIYEDISYPCSVVHPMAIPEAWDYLTSPKPVGRGLSLAQIEYYGIVAASDPPYLGRIFIPTRNKGKFVFWVARTYIDQIPRYLNPKGLSKRHYIFGLDQAKSYDTVIITEGVFSAIAAGPNAVATFGKAVSDEQRRLLLDSGFSKYVVALDGDAVKEGLLLSRWFSSRNKDTYMVSLGIDKDPDEDALFRDKVESAHKFDFYNTIASSLGSME